MTDEELFDGPADRARLMEDFGLTEEEARTIRALNLA